MKRQMPDVKVPERVAFVNVNKGDVFFDCHPAEARLAIHAIREARAVATALDGGVYRDYLANAASRVTCFDEDLSGGLAKLLSEFSPAPSALVRLSSAIDVLAEAELSDNRACRCMEAESDSTDLLEVIAEGFRRVEDCDVVVSHVVLNEKSFAFLREADKSVWDVEERHALQNIGVVGLLWGAWVCVRRCVPDGEVVVGAYSSPIGIRDYFCRVRAVNGLSAVGSLDRVSPRLEAALERLTRRLRHELRQSGEKNRD